MTQKAMSKATIDEIRSRRRRNESYPTIAQKMGIGIGTAHRYGKDVVPILQVPGLNGADPEERTAIQLTHEQYVSLSKPAEAVVVAAGIVQDSLKTRMMRAIAEQGPFPGVPELLNALRDGPRDQSFGPHEVTHLLYSLNKQGCIAYKTTRRGTSSSLLTDIRATGRGYTTAGIPIPGKSQEGKHGGRAVGTSRAGHAIGTDMTEQRNHKSRAEGGPIERSRAPRSPLADDLVANALHGNPFVAPEAPPAVLSDPAPQQVAQSATPERWPLLEALRKERAEAQAHEERVLKLMAAADMLVDVDPEAAADMLARADAATGRQFTPLEAEYLRFAEEVPRG